MPREHTHLEFMLVRSKVHSLIQDVNAPTGATQTGFSTFVPSATGSDP